MTEALIPTTQNKIDQLVNKSLAGLKSPNTKRAYRREIRAFLVWLNKTEQGLSYESVEHYKDWMLEQNKSDSSINAALVAIRAFVKKLVKFELLTPEKAQIICSVESIKTPGNKAGNWLTKKQAEDYLQAPKESSKANSLLAYRDRACLALLIGCGLRRAEAQALTVEHIQQREGRWVIVDLVGKRNKTRSVPIAHWCKAIIDQWLEKAGIESGYILRVCSWSKKDGKAFVSDEQLSCQGIYRTVKRYGHVTPHDLRRSFAKIARKNGATLEQISLSLGHDSIETTQRYLGMDLDLVNSPSDLLQLEVEI